MTVQRFNRLSFLTATSLLALAVGANAQEGGGFAISTGGKTIAGDPAVGALVPHPPQAAIGAADIQVRADGLGVRPRLELEVVSVGPGVALVQSRLNYSAWIKRAEVRVLDLRTGRLVQTVAIAPNGSVAITLPWEGDFAAVHCVYDAAGRYDETTPVALTKIHAARTAQGDGVEEGVNSTARRRIPISAGAVTVSGTGLAPGATIQTLGETIRPDASGAFVLQRILPPGDQAVPVRIIGGGQSRQIEPVVTIPKSDWFYVVTADLTVGHIIAGRRKGETLSIEVRDPVTGRIISQRTLVEGRDYQINYLQGLITLSAPLSASTGGGTLTPAPGSAPVTTLVAQYEYTPTIGDIDGFAYGGRVEAWVTDRLRVGVTGMVDQTDTADQTATGADIRYEFGTGSFIEAETARSEGPGFGKSYSADGGLIVANTGATAGTGTAKRFKAEVDLADLGLTTKGTVAGYFEDRGAGFSTLDYQTTAAGTLWGRSADIAPGERLSFRAAYDVDYQTSKFLTLSGGLEFGRVEDPSGTFDRSALSFGLKYDNDAGLTARARLERWRDRGSLAKAGQNADTLLFRANASYKISDEACPM